MKKDLPFLSILSEAHLRETPAANFKFQNAKLGKFFPNMQMGPLEGGQLETHVKPISFRMRVFTFFNLYLKAFFECIETNGTLEELGNGFIYKTFIEHP